MGETTAPQSFSCATMVGGGPVQAPIFLELHTKYRLSGHIWVHLVLYPRHGLGLFGVHMVQLKVGMTT